MQYNMYVRIKVILRKEKRAMERIITVKLNSLRDFREFMECATMLNGSARAIQGETNVDAKSTLGIASIMDTGSFNLKFIDCSDTEIEKFSQWKI